MAIGLSGRNEPFADAFEGDLPTPCPAKT